MLCDKQLLTPSQNSKRSRDKCYATNVMRQMLCDKCSKNDVTLIPQTSNGGNITLILKMLTSLPPLYGGLHLLLVVESGESNLFRLATKWWTKLDCIVQERLWLRQSLYYLPTSTEGPEVPGVTLLEWWGVLRDPGGLIGVRVKFLRGVEPRNEIPGVKFELEELKWYKVSHII
jgi:hypothetical protein